MKDYKGMSKSQIDTPALILDFDLLESNIGKMEKWVTSHDKRLRPHAKTHKCSRIAKMQINAGSIGICVAKVSEAMVLADAGITSILITSPVVTPQKMKHLMNVHAQVDELIIVVDNIENAHALNKAAAQHQTQLHVLAELDPVFGRTGARYKDGLALGQALHELPNLTLRGIQCYAGNAQHIVDYNDRYNASLDYWDKAIEVLDQFRLHNLPCDILTGSGTGTFDIDMQIKDLTDLQSGSYTIMDAEYDHLESADGLNRFHTFASSMTLMTTVISVNQPKHVTVDAGLKTLYHHGGTPYIIRPADRGLIYDWYGDEHGKISFDDPVNKPALGDVLELVVSHCDPTVNLFDHYFVTRKDRVIDVWPIDLRGKSQ